MTQFSVNNVAVEFGATVLFENLSFTVTAGERWGVVGRNGTGKTTLFRLITGAAQPNRGQIARMPGLRVALLDQHRDFAGAETVWDAAAGAFAETIALERSLAAQATALAHDSGESAMERYGRDLERFERMGGYTYASQTDAVLHGLGFDPEESRSRPLSQLSGGERGRLGLARQLVQPADVLLLDEPTNHLDLETTRWLEEYLLGTDRTVILVSHDRAFLAAVSDHVLHFEGRSATPYACGYETFVMQRAERRLAQQRQFDKQQRVVAAETDYIARNLAGQNTRQAKGRRKRLERLPRLSGPTQEDSGAMALRLDIAERGGDQVLVAEKAEVGVEGRVLIRDLTARVMRGDRIALVGPNGAGKSTLLRTIMGERPAQGGRLTIGGAVRVAYYRQDMAQVPLDRTLFEVIQDLRPLWERGMVHGHLARFGFSGDQVLRRASTLSGGERARVALAMMMLARANLLILDEPTNHLDVESIEALEDAVESYDGSVILVSHDRALLRALGTRVWSLHGERVHQFDGPFAEWEAVQEEVDRKAAEAERQAAERARQAGGRVTGGIDRDRSPEREQRNARRRAQQVLSEAEAEVAAREADVGRAAKALENPALYENSDGALRAGELSRTLDEARRALERALQRWESASAAAEQVAN